MSGAKIPPPAGVEPGANDPSMEDILASIRRILSEEEPAAAAPAPAPVAAAPEPEVPEEKPDDVLVLDSSMLVPEEPPAPPMPPEPMPSEPMPSGPMPSGPAAIEPAVIEPGPPEPVAPMDPPPSPAVLLAPETEAAATSSVGNLMRTLATERTLQVHRDGPTIEDIVREELRPLLKHWLDANLPDLVERLVRAEIERVVRHAVP